ncbi:hypothetical protein Nepgr_020034 [Nepenthes gracilis]|uniref:Uncharacterized protein n=1 Tax=Nepenthes gracilis TaxID=150966 RepID=A0AAD3XUX2_NEPGR|nr:hypothetical protein Nepgr_020034 [Nepenthes gracilis]
MEMAEMTGEFQISFNLNFDLTNKQLLQNEERLKFTISMEKYLYKIFIPSEELPEVGELNPIASYFEIQQQQGLNLQNDEFPSAEKQTLGTGSRSTIQVQSDFSTNPRYVRR